MSYNINLNYKQPQTWKFGLYGQNWTEDLDKIRCLQLLVRTVHKFFVPLL